jgi:hypothetical protein
VILVCPILQKILLQILVLPLQVDPHREVRFRAEMLVPRPEAVRASSRRKVPPLPRKSPRWGTILPPVKV